MLSYGFFGRVSTRYWSLLAEMWAYLRHTNVFAKVLGFVVFVIYAPFLAAAGLAFALLVPLDLVAAAVEAIRRSLLAFFRNMEDVAADNFFGFLIVPVVLFVLAVPILVVAILPKLSGLTDEA